MLAGSVFFQCYRMTFQLCLRNKLFSPVVFRMLSLHGAHLSQFTRKRCLFHPLIVGIQQVLQRWQVEPAGDTNAPGYESRIPILHKLQNQKSQRAANDAVPCTQAAAPNHPSSHPVQFSTSTGMKGHRIHIRGEKTRRKIPSVKIKFARNFTCALFRFLNTLLA